MPRPFFLLTLCCIAPISANAPALLPLGSLSSMQACVVGFITSAVVGIILGTLAIVSFYPRKK
jgi:ABC-type nitrate/sulfonate/bicarbonate transport system permease component